MFDKNYFLSRLHAGDSIDAIGEEIAAAMNAAVADYDAELESIAAKKAEEDMKLAKMDLIRELFEIIQELAILEGFDPEIFKIEDSDLEQTLWTFETMFAALRNVEDVLNKPKTDDKILSEFVKIFS